MNFLNIILCLTLINVVLSDDKAWHEHKTKFSLNFHNDHHHNKSKANFLRSLNLIKLHNTKYNAKQVTYKLGLNQFSHLSDEEMKQYKGFRSNNSSKRSLSDNKIIYIEDIPITVRTFNPTPNWTPPESYDVENKWSVPVRDQGQCLSCWAFSVAATIEGAAKIQLGIPTGELSPKQLVDCANTGPYGCSRGGWPLYAISWVKKYPQYALATEANYPYHTQYSYCMSTSQPFINIKEIIVPQENSDLALMEALVKFGPISIAIDTSLETFKNYHSGIWDGTDLISGKICSNNADHAMVLIGFGNENGIPYFRIKNQYGKNWGDNGYIKIKRGINLCGIASYAVSVLL